MHDVIARMNRKANLAIINFQVLITISGLSSLFLLWEASEMKFSMNGYDILLIVNNTLVGIAYLVAGVFFMIWFFATYQRLYVESPETLRYAPVWTVLGFSLPIANLLLPYVLVVSLWRQLAVKPSVDTSDAERRAPSYFTYWWLSHLSVFFGIPAVYLVAATHVDSSELLLVQVVLSGLAYLLVGNTARFAIRLVKEINSLQMQIDHMVGAQSRPEWITNTDR